MTVMCSGPAVPKLPFKPSEGDGLCDHYGNRWEYSSGVWVSKGVVSAPAHVSEDIDGIISADIFTKLEKLKTYIDTGVDLRPLKLYPGVDAYWYYFRSSDKCIRFTPEGPSALRIEIDKGRMFQILMKEICVGPKGPRGLIGDKGFAGKPGPDELCFEPSVIHENRLDFAMFVPVPLTLDGPIGLPNKHVPDISIRISARTGAVEAVDQLQHMAFVLNKYVPNSPVLDTYYYARDEFSKRALGQVVNLCEIPLSRVVQNPGLLDDPVVTIDISPVDPSNITITVVDEFPIDEESTLATIKYDPETSIVCGSVILEPPAVWADIASAFCVHARQRGPDGMRGIPGECMIKIVECDVDSTNIIAECPLINARLDCESDSGKANTIYTLCAGLLEEVCVEFVNLLPNSSDLADGSVLDSVFATAQTILDECKYINKYRIELKEDEVPELDLVHWDPQPGCVTKRHFDKHKFDWIPETDIPACATIATWFGPDDTRPGIYPYDIVAGEEPAKDECCEEDFFWCDNTGTGGTTGVAQALSMNDAWDNI